MKRSSRYTRRIDRIAVAILRGQATTHVFCFWTALALALPGAALAQDDFDRNGIYLGLGIAGAVYTEAEDELARFSQGPVEVGVPAGLDTRVGYRFHPRGAGEIQLQWLPGADVQSSDVKTKLETLSLTWNAKGYLLTGELQPFLMTGIGFMHFDVKDTGGLGVKATGEGFAARFGGGLEYYWIRNLLLSIDTSYVLPTGSADALDQVSFSIGIQYRF